ncbi:MAG: hypothetical protein H6Q58_1493 [Firmicutes bacterium]|nr:hypothetical protein [Bacillota bacterium]
MKISFLPKTRSGKWSVVLFAAYAVLVAASKFVSEIQNNTIEYPNPFNSPLLGSLLYLTFFASFMASVIGLFAVFKKGERSILVFLAIPNLIYIMIYSTIFQ